jgi:hypothetical protein
MRYSYSPAVLLTVACITLPSPAGERFDPKSLPLFTEGKLYLDQYETGLYPGGVNEMPAAHREAGLRMARAIRPLDGEGRPDDRNGRIVAVIKGHSNATLYATEFQNLLREKAEEVNDRFVFVIGSVAGNQLPEIRRLEGPVWDRSMKYISRAGCTPSQVQVLFLHTTFNGPGNPAGQGPPPPPFPESMRQMQRDVAAVLAHCVKIYPNLKIAYLTSDGLRHFTGMEPHVWREAFAIKWLIESQIRGEEGTEFQDAPGKPRILPWMCWGPYIWDNTWDRSYFRDGVHPTPQVCRQVAEKYYAYLRADPIAQPWMFKARAAAP